MMVGTNNKAVVEGAVAGLQFFESIGVVGRGKFRNASTNSLSTFGNARRRFLTWN